MSLSDTFRLILLAALWGASFMFMRIAAPEFGPVVLILVRLATAALLIWLFLLKNSALAQVRNQFGVFLFGGFFNNALPGVLLSFSALSISSGLNALLNAATPIFTALIAFLWLAVPLKRLQVLGLLVGIVGVGVLSSDNLEFKSGGTGWAVLAALGAAVCYGIGVNYTRQKLSGLSSSVTAFGTLAGASVTLLPAVPFTWPEANPSMLAWAAAIGLATLGTALPYVIFFKLLKSAGATPTATVTFIVPVFALIWGTLLLDEELTTPMIIGMIVTLLGSALATGLIRNQPKSQNT
ncbi:MAG: DMT family transporter [Opitutales bacterium]